MRRLNEDAGTDVAKKVDLQRLAQQAQAVNPGDGATAGVDGSGDPTTINSRMFDYVSAF